LTRTEQDSQAMTGRTGVPANPAALPIALLVWSLSALAFGYAFFQRVAPSVMVPDLMAEFAVSGAVLGQLSALYFYPYAALQLPIGALLDRYGARAMLTTALLAAGSGSLMFALARSIELAYGGRFLVGAGCAVGFIGSMALAAKWFNRRYFAMLAGFSMFFAMMCGMAGQAPLAWAVEAVGWRTTMLWAGGFAVCLSLLVALVVRNAPPGSVSTATSRHMPWADIGAGLVATIRRNEVWRISVVAMSMSGPMLALGGLWGVPYLTENYGLDRPTAAFYASLSLFGWAVGAPFSGWLSDRINLRKKPLVAGAALNTLLLAVIAFATSLPLPLMAVALFLSGLTGASMVVSFALVREVSPETQHGTVTGLVNGMTVAAGAVLQPTIGWLLDLVWDGTMDAGARVYQAADYRFAFVSLVVWAGIGLLFSFTLRETYCRQL
jgi:MFS family permease